MIAAFANALMSAEPVNAVGSALPTTAQTKILLRDVEPADR